MPIVFFDTFTEDDSKQYKVGELSPSSTFLWRLHSIWMSNTNEAKEAKIKNKKLQLQHLKALRTYLYPLLHQSYRTWQPFKDLSSNTPIFKALCNCPFHLMTVTLMENIQKKSTSCACIINKFYNSIF